MADITRIGGNGRYSRSVEAGGVIYIAGQVGRREGDMAQQTKDILDRMDQILADNGSDKEHILSATVFIKDVAEAGAMNAVWDAWVVPGTEPARICVQAEMLHPDFKVEIGMIAAKK